MPLSLATRPLPSGTIRRVAHGAAGMSCAVLVAAGAAHAEAAALAAPRAIVAGRDLGIPFHSIHGIAVDARRGEIVATDPGRHEVVSFDTSGVLLGFFVHRVTGYDGAVVDGRPAAIAIDAAGRLLIADLDARYVDVTDFGGRPLARLEVPGSENYENGPGAIAVAPDGRIFVATRGDSSAIHVFDRDYRLVSSWGVAGADSGRLSGVNGLAVLPDGRVAVSCALTRLAVQVFDASGVFQFGFGLHDMGPQNFSLPSGVTATADGRIWVADELRQIVQVFDLAGKHLGWIGGMGEKPGEFGYPRALASDGRHLLAVAERVGNRIQVWRTQ